MIRVSPRADLAIESVAVYLGRQSPQAEHRFLRALSDAFQLLDSSPGIGRCIPLRDPMLFSPRVWPIGRFQNYLILYRQIEGGIEILDVFHGAQNPQRRFDV